MENLKILTILFDYYESLLTEKQRKYFVDYYFNDLSLSEISENYDISKSAVSKQLNEIISKLEYYEKNLNLYKKRNEILKIIENINDENIKKQISDLI